MDTVTSADGTAIAFDGMGAGPPLVMVVGAFCDRASGESLAAALASDFTVYRYDRRGRGDSGDGTPWAIEREVEDLEAVIAAVGGSAVAYGHSSGGSIVLETAAHGPAVEKAAVYEPPYTGNPAAEFARELADLAAAGRLDEAAERFVLRTGAPREMIKQMQAGPGWAHMRALADTLSYDVALSNDGRVPAERLATISIPVLALGGGAGAGWGPAAAEAIAAAVPGGEWRVLEGQHHAAADEVLAPVLREFLG